MHSKRALEKGLGNRRLPAWAIAGNTGPKEMASYVGFLAQASVIIWTRSRGLAVSRQRRHASGRHHSGLDLLMPTKFASLARLENSVKAPPWSITRLSLG
jgi:hypothetical protein